MSAANQHPTFEVRPEGSAEYGTAADAVELAAIAGITLMDWQTEQVRRILALRPDGQWHAARHGLAVGRQNGKGVVLEVVALAAAILLGERVLWTAHEVKTSLESFARFRALLDATPSLRHHVAAVRTASGAERVEFTNGAVVRFSARSKSATRGLGFRRIIADEAQELDYLAMSALLPTLSGQGTAATQLILTGTPPYSKAGEVFTDTRAAAYEGGDPRLSWAEWSCEPTDRTDDRDLWARLNPSMGVVIMEQKIIDEYAALASRPDVFRRERLGEWGRSGEVQLAIPPEQWARGAHEAATWPEPSRSRRGGKLVRFVGIDTTYERDFTCLVEATPLDGDHVGLEVIYAAPGLEWITAAFDQLSTTGHTVAVFDPARVGDLTPDLRAAGLRERTGERNQIMPVNSRGLTAACDGLVRAVSEGRLHHHDPRLDAAAACATRSTYDDGRGWKLVATDAGNVTPLVAGAIAVHALRNITSRTRHRSNRAMFA